MSDGNAKSKKKKKKLCVLCNNCMMVCSDVEETRDE